MRIVFMGTPEFAVPSLRALLDRPGCEVVGVFTQPDRPSGRGNRLTPPPTKVLAQERGVPVFQPEKIGRDGYADLAALAPDLCVTAAFGQILSQKVLDVPKMGTINVHASLLPRHRGSAPINWAILQGDAEAGVTTMYTFRGIDNGDMLLKSAVKILPGETAGELTERLSHLGASTLMATLDALQEGTLRPEPQAEADMTYDPKLEKSMGVIDWTDTAQNIVNRIHGLNPWPGAATAFPEGTLKLWKAEISAGSGEPGTVLAADAKSGLVLACGDGAVKLTSIQAPGGKKMDARDYLKGHPAQVGAVWHEEKA